MNQDSGNGDDEGALLRLFAMFLLGVSVGICLTMMFYEVMARLR